MTEDIPLEITSSGMANLPIFIAVLIVAAVVGRVYFSIRHNEKPPIARVFWCAMLLIPLGMVAAWITTVPYGSFLIRRSVLPPSYFLSNPWFRDLSTKPILRRERLPVFAATSLSSPLFQRSRSFHSKLPATKRSIAFPPTHSGFPLGCSRRFCSPFICWDSVMEASWPSCPSSVAPLALPSTSS